MKSVPSTLGVLTAEPAESAELRPEKSPQGAFPEALATPEKGSPFRGEDTRGTYGNRG